MLCKYNYILKSMTYIEDKLQIKLLNELYKMENQTIFKGKTLVIYDLYKDA